MATAQADIHIKVDPNIKTKSEVILNKIGISMSDLINMTLRRVIYEQRIPFDTRVADQLTPDSLQVSSSADFVKRLEEGEAYNRIHSEAYTSDELRSSLGI